MSTARGQVIAIGDLLRDRTAGDGPLSFGASWTDEQWAAHDAEVAKQREAEDRQANGERAAIRRRQFEKAGFPLRAVEAAQHADETAATIRRIADWDVARESVLVLSGPRGCGKTVAAAWWALRRAWPPTFVRATTFAASSRYDREQRDTLLKAEAMVLDDLGAEYADAKGSFLVDLDELIDVFYGDRRPLLITTNCLGTEFAKRYGERIVDRLRECGSFWSTDEQSRRSKP